METGKSGVCREAKGGSIQVFIPGQILILGDLNGRANTPAQKALKTQDPESGTIKSENFFNTGYYLHGKTMVVTLPGRVADAGSHHRFREPVERES